MPNDSITPAKENVTTKLSLEFAARLPDDIEYPSKLLSAIYGTPHGYLMLEIQRAIVHLDRGPAEKYWKPGWDGEDCYMLPRDLFFQVLTIVDPELFFAMMQEIGAPKMREITKEHFGLDLGEL